MRSHRSVALLAAAAMSMAASAGPAASSLWPTPPVPRRREPREPTALDLQRMAAADAKRARRAARRLAAARGAA